MGVANVKSGWVSGNLVFQEETIGNGAQIHFGVDDDGLDVKFFGATSGAYMLWDESADQLVIVGTETITVSGLNASTGRALKIDATVAAPAHADGYGVVEINANFSGTVAGPYAAASSTWINMASASVPGAHIITPRNDGIYLPTGITASSAKMVMGGRFHYVADDGANPGSLFLFSTNIFSNALTALLDINAIEDLSNTTTKSGGGIAIPFAKTVNNATTYYLNLYTS